MTDKKSLIEQARDMGQAFIAISIVAGALGAASVKAWGWAKAGPLALTKAEKLERDVALLKRQSRFTVHILEKIGKEKYDWKSEGAGAVPEENE